MSALLVRLLFRNTVLAVTLVTLLIVFAAVTRYTSAKHVVVPSYDESIRLQGCCAWIETGEQGNR